MTELVNFIVICLLIFIASAMCLWLVRILWGSFNQVTGGKYKFFSGNFWRKGFDGDKVLSRVDELMAEKHFNEALAMLEKSLVFAIPRDQQTLERIVKFHQGVFSRCILIAESLGSQLSHIAEFEGALAERSDLLKLLVKAELAYKSFLEKRKTAGKSVPEWGKEDYEGKISHIKEALAANQETLDDCKIVFFRSIRSIRPEKVTYH